MITNAKIHGSVCNRDYMRQEVKRGDYAYVMSRSELKLFSACPAKWINGYRGGTSDEQSWGDMLDCMMFTPEDFTNRFVVAPATYPAKGKKKDDPTIQKKWNKNAEYCKAWLEDQPDGVTAIKHEESLAIFAARAALFADDAIRPLLQRSKFQVLVTADWEDGGRIVPLKGCIDIVPNDGPCLADLKTCASAHPKAWPRQVDSFGYDTQGAMYLDLYNAATGESRDQFRHVLQENYEPWQVGRRVLSEEFISLGRLKYQSAIRRYIECLESGIWPDYEVNELQLDGWSITEPEPWMILNSPPAPDPGWLTPTHERKAAI